MIAEITVLKKRIKELERYRMHLEEMVFLAIVIEEW